jgi:hypothetical protein
MIRQAEKDFLKEVKRLVKENPEADYKFCIAGEMKEKKPCATIDVENYHAAKYLLEQLDGVKYAEDAFDRYKNQSPIVINFVIYEKNQSH